MSFREFFQKERQSQVEREEAERVEEQNAEKRRMKRAFQALTGSRPERGWLLDNKVILDDITLIFRDDIQAWCIEGVCPICGAELKGDGTVHVQRESEE